MLDDSLIDECQNDIFVFFGLGVLVAELLENFLNFLALSLYNQETMITFQTT
jgi:hypothetical protein